MKELYKSKAFYYKGLTIEPDISLQSLRIEGQLIDIEKKGKLFLYKKNSEISDEHLNQLGIKIIDSWQGVLDKREKINEEHLQILNKGVKHWNQWRRENPQIRPILYNAPLNHRDFRSDEPIDFSNANLIQAQLINAHLERANFHEANLGQANLSYAYLDEAHFCRTDLYHTNLSNAELYRANLQGTQMAMTDLTGAKLRECKIYGLAAWDVIIKDTVQKDFKIIYSRENKNGELEENQIVVDDLRVAQFIYLLLHNENIRYVIDTISSKAVLILGRFTRERKVFLDAIADELRKKNFVPIIFDFERSLSRDFTETIKTLTSLCLFVIVDITNPKSAPLELQATVPDYMIPFVPIIQEGEEPFSMFNDLWAKYNWMLEPVNYPSHERLREIFERAILDRAWKKHQELQNAKTEKVKVQSWKDFLRD